MLIYLASPYTPVLTKTQRKELESMHPRVRETILTNMREQRFQQVSKAAAGVMYAGHQVFCPIAHSHPIEVYGMTTRMDGDFWLNQDFAILQFCDEMWVLKLEGYDRSKGIKREIEFAEKRGIPVKFIEEGNYGSVPAIYSSEPVRTA